MVRDLGVRSAVVGRWFFAALGLVGALGTASVFWVGGYLVIQGDMSLGTVIMFSSLLVQLYGPLSAMSNARVEFATSLVSFERVFEVLDLPQEIVEKPDARVLTPVTGTVEFEGVFFRYEQPDRVGLTAPPEAGRSRTLVSASNPVRWRPWWVLRVPVRPPSAI